MAKIEYGLFDYSADDLREYTQADVARALRAMSRDGVSVLEDNLRVASAGAGLQVRVGYGTAFIRGYYMEIVNDGGAAFTLAHSANSSMLPRIDRVVMQLDFGPMRKISLMVRSGVAAANPVPPTLMRTGTVWELSLAQVRVNPGTGLLTNADITDEREDDAVCGAIGSARTDLVQKLLKAASISTDTPGQSIQAALDSKLNIANVANNLTTTASSPIRALDARQGPVISKAITDTVAAANPMLYTVTLTSIGWTGSAAPFGQNISLPQALATGYLYLAYPHPDHYASFVNASIVMHNITANGTIPFRAQKRPTSNITVHVIRWPQG